MEKLTVHNFLTLRSATIEVRKINVLIGPQASGKSVIAKLLYFFKKEVGDAFKGSVRQMQGKRELSATLKAKFETIFPQASWTHQEFDICYEYGDWGVSIKGTKTSSGRVSCSISYSEMVLQLQSTLKKRYKSAVEEAKLNPEEEGPDGLLIPSFTSDESYIFYHSVINIITKPTFSQHFKDQIFIPASRTFFASLQKNIFSFLASNIDIDYFLKEFGSVYEQTKKIYYRKNILVKQKPKEIDTIIENIIAGRYLYENEQDWIVNDARKINLANASSGQQESLPMLLVLSVMPFIGTRQLGFFIEEPEAHLFPVSQKAFISLLAMIANKTDHQFFITTHSPYLLTALNNCIIAHEAFHAADEAQKEKVLAIMPSHQHIAFADVAAWTITDKGTVQSILDSEAGIIGASILDGISQDFETVTNELLDIRYGEQAL